jgi:hypothetical protein
MKFHKVFKKYQQFPAVIAVSLSVFTGCGPQAAEFSILPAFQNTFQGSVANNKVDILWVVDNSGTMLTKQQNLSAGFSSFIQVFQNKGFDFRMAVVTTDLRPAPAGQEGIFQAQPYNGDSYFVLTNNTPDVAEHFKANIEVGDNGHWEERPLDAVELALSPALLNGANAGFLRNDAHLAVIMVSDVDDSFSVITPVGLVDFLNGIKPDKFDVISRTYKKNFTISAVVVDVTNPGNTACLAPFEDGIKFKNLVAATNGSLASICEADFSDGLNQISQRIAEAITEIPLAREPDVSTIKITFNGVSVPMNAANGWTYSSAGNKVSFHGNSIPTDNTAISINYTPKDIIR